VQGYGQLWRQHRVKAIDSPRHPFHWFHDRHPPCVRALWRGDLSPLGCGAAPAFQS